MLLDQGGDPSMMRNTHHVIPRAYGGAQGPTVSLDSAHHDLLHLVANKMMSKSEWEHLVKDMPKTWRERVLYLATRVVVAANFTENDPNKRVFLTLDMNKTVNSRLQALADLHGCSKSTLLLKLAEAEYVRCFQPRQRK